MSAAVGDVQGGCDIAAAGARGGGGMTGDMSVREILEMCPLQLAALPASGAPAPASGSAWPNTRLSPRRWHAEESTAGVSGATRLLGCPGRAASPLWSTHVQLTTH